MLAAVLYLTVVVGLSSAQDYDYVDTCPEINGFFADALQCDRYYECQNGEVSEHFCDDGLVFDESSVSFAKCSYPFATDCTGRNQLQEAQSTPGCPRKHGYFSDPDPTVCDRFSFCVDGTPNPITCPDGLIFDPSKGQCAWSDQVNRPGCTSLDFFKFTCPDNPAAVHEHPRYPDPEDCQFFYICIGGTNARRNGCGAPPMVFNEVSLSCEDQRKVEGRCSTWFNETYLESIGPKPTPSPRQKIALETRRKTLNPNRGAPRRQSIQPTFPPEQIPQVLTDLAGFGQNEPIRNAAPSIDNRPFERPPQRAPIETDTRQFERPPQRSPVVNTNRVRGRAQSSRPNGNSFESSQTGLRTQAQQTRAPVRTRSRTRVGIPRRRTTQAPVTEAPRFESEERLNFLNDLRGSISDSQNTIVQATPKATFTRPPRRRGNTGRRQPTLRPVPAVPDQEDEQHLPFLDTSSQGSRNEAATGFGRRRRPPGSRTAQQTSSQPEQEQSTRSRVSAKTAVDLGPSDLQALVNSVRGPPPAAQETQFTTFTRTQPKQESFSSQRRAPVSRGGAPPQSFREEEESFSSQRRAPLSRGRPPPQSFREEEESFSSRRAPVSRGGPPPQSFREEEESFSSRRAPVSRGGGFGGRRPVADTTEPNEPIETRGRLEVTRLNSLPALNNFEEDESEFAQFRAAQSSRSRQRNGK